MSDKIKLVFHRKRGWIEFLRDDVAVPFEKIPPPIQIAAKQMMPAYADGESVILEVDADGFISAASGD